MSLEKWIEEQGVIIGFVPCDARLNFEETKDEQTVRSIGMRLNLEVGEDVRLPDNRTLKNALWTMYLVEASEFNENVANQGAIGFFSYFDESARDDNHRPEECHISAALKPEKFATLLSTIQSGRLPEQVSITVRGMSYGWEPDGSGKTWDVKATPHAPVTKLAFGIPLIAPRISPSSASDSTERIDYLPASSADIRALQSNLMNQIAALRLTAWKVLVYLVLAMAVLWLFRH